MFETSVKKTKQKKQQQKKQIFGQDSKGEK